MHSSSFQVLISGNRITGEVPVDSTIGNGSMFSFTWSVQGSSPPTVTLESPSNCTYSTDSARPDLCPDSVAPVVNSVFNLITFSIPGIAEVCCDDICVYQGCIQ